MERTMACCIIADFLPDEVGATVMPLVDANLDVLPGWIVELDVLWDDELPVIGQMRPHVDYRRGKLTIGPSWLGATHEMRRRTIIHEFIHVQLGPLHSMCVQLLDIAGKGNEALDSALRDTFRTALEQTTVDVTSLVERLLNYCARTSEPATQASAEPSSRSRSGPAIAPSNGAER